jgi:hypothetical protein
MLQPMQHTVLFSKRSLHIVLSSAGFRRIELKVGTKIMTAEYLAQQLREHGSLFSKLYTVTAMRLPTRMQRVPIRVNIGETLAFATAPA